MIPARFAPVVFGFILSGLMSFIVSGVSISGSVALNGAFFGHWIAAWIPSWLIAFPTVLFVAPLTRRLVAKLVRAD